MSHCSWNTLQNWKNKTLYMFQVCEEPAICQEISCPAEQNPQHLVVPPVRAEPSSVPAEGNATHDTQPISLLLHQSLLCSGSQDLRVLPPTFSSVLHEQTKNQVGLGFSPIYLTPQSIAHHPLQHNCKKKLPFNEK